jgi:type IV pilus assembly protein PilV
MNTIKRMHFRADTKSSSNGFTLIEVLIALLILAVGVLGIVALQFKTLKYSHDASLRSQISFLAYDISDRMRGNRANAAAYVAHASNPYLVITTAPATACVQATGANAANDLACWHHQVFNALPPKSTAGITAAAGLYTVALAWEDRSGETHTINYTFQP